MNMAPSKSFLILAWIEFLKRTSFMHNFRFSIVDLLFPLYVLRGERDNCL